MNLINKKIQQEALKALDTIISQPSYNQKATKNAPFGKNIRQALEKMMNICQNLGFKTYIDPDGYYGYAETGQGEKTFGIICHLDTVPVSELTQWKYDPFKCTVEDGIIYGRGIQDDKGPTIAALFAVKALMDSNYTFNKKIRLIFGTDEEVLWRDMHQYNKKENNIDLGFVPDDIFPVTYAEKGLQQSYLIGPGTNQLNVKITGPFNAVPDQAFYNGPKLIEIEKILNNLNFNYQKNEKGLTVLGKTVHTKKAPEGINAISRLSIALSQVFNFQPLNFLGKLVKEDATGASVLGDIKDDTGQLTFNISSLEINEKETRMQLDMRIPSTINHDQLIDKLSKEVQKYDLKYQNYDYVKPLHISINSELVQTLMNVYQQITNDKQTSPQASGGATFARTMNNCVAFGALLPTTPYSMHQVNENWPLNDFYKAMNIYAEAIKRLCVD